MADLENGSLDKVNATLKLLNLYDRYATIFKEEEMTDELVQHCIEDRANALGQIIPILGQRIKFEKTFLKLAQDEVADNAKQSSQEKNSQNTAAETSASEPSPLKHCWLPPAIREELLGNIKMEQLIEPWTSIANSLNIANANSKETILKETVTKAIKTYEAEIELNFQLPTDCFTEPQLNEIRTSAEESARSFLAEILHSVDSESLAFAKKILDEELLKRVGPLHIRNMKHTEACIEALEGAAEGICETFVNVIKEQVLQRVLTRAEFDNIAASFKQASQVQFAEACEHLPRFHTAILEQKIDQRREYFWFQVQQMGEEFSRIRENIVERAVKLYEESIQAGAMARTQLEEAHDFAKDRAMKLFSDPSIEPGLREAALKEFQRKALDLKRKVAEKLES